MSKKNDVRQLLIDFATEPPVVKEEVPRDRTFLAMLKKSEVWQRRGFEVLWELTHRFEVDGIGFNRYHANQAETVWKEYKLYGDHTRRSLAWLKKVIPQYHRQLKTIADAKRRVPSPLFLFFML